MTPEIAKQHVRDVFAWKSALVAQCRGCGEWTWVGSTNRRCYCCAGGGLSVPPAEVISALRGYGVGFYGGSN